MPADTKLEPMYIMKRASNDYSWKILELLGAGGYGSVYKVIRVNHNNETKLEEKEYAMKTESKSASRVSSRLKIEKNVMREYSKKEPHHREHFPELLDSGQSTTLKWIVMTLVGPSIESLRKNGFTLPTALRCGLQTGKAISDLHAIGFLHRDIKPGNFCAGLGVNIETVYILDFGLARIYKRKDGTIRPLRTRVKMTGTPRYCSRASHMRHDLGRKDDFESWYYMLLDLIDYEKGIQWKGKHRDIAFQMKKKMFEQPTWISTIAPAIPESFGLMAKYIDQLEYSSPVEWGVFREIITDCARDMKITLTESFDWIPADKSVKTPVVPAPSNNKIQPFIKKHEIQELSKTCTTAALSAVSAATAADDENSMNTQVGECDTSSTMSKRRPDKFKQQSSRTNTTRRARAKKVASSRTDFKKSNT